MNKLVLIAMGGLLGTLCRYGLSLWVDQRIHSPFPYGTMAVNLAGCFVAGILFPVLENAAVPPELRLAVFVGFLGGFTTFSAYGMQTVALANDGMLTLAILNVVASNAAGLLMVWIGSSLSRSVL